MTHLAISAHPTNIGAYQLTIDDVDLSTAVLLEGFSISLDGPMPQVKMTVAADVLDVDLPEVVIAALRESEDVA